MRHSSKPMMPSHYALKVYFLAICAWTILILAVGSLQMIYILKVQPQVYFFIIPVLVGIAIGAVTAHIIILTLKLKWFMNHDPLTHVYNHAYFSDQIERLCMIYQQSEEDLSLLVLNIDNFKKVNEQYGRRSADLILIEFASLIHVNKRQVDICSRYGREEFALLLPGSSSKDAHALAERLRREVEDYVMPHGISISCSIGVAQFSATDDSANNLLKRADEALYKAKTAERNRLEVDA